MLSLGRRRSGNPHEVTWHIFYDDIRVGTTGELVRMYEENPTWLKRWQPE